MTSPNQSARQVIEQIVEGLQRGLWSAEEAILRAYEFGHMAGCIEGLDFAVKMFNTPAAGATKEAT
jgi:hypothetical protein